MKVETLLFEIDVMLGKTELSFSAYSQLQIGDILVLDQKASSPLDIKVANEILFHGQPGLFEMKKAIKIQ